MKGTRASHCLRTIDQETARSVAVLGRNGAIMGSGCLVDERHILTCLHVIKDALRKKPTRGSKVAVELVGIQGRPRRTALLRKAGTYLTDQKSENDLALLELTRAIDVTPAEFATPLRHGGKNYSVLGFPDEDPQGKNASGRLHAMNANGLVQMDGNSSLFVRGGYSGAPVWSSEVGGIVGIVATELFDSRVAWCIPSRRLSLFHRSLLVRFCIPEPDRPVIHDYWEDDPNVQLFGERSRRGGRILTATIEQEQEKDGGMRRFCVKATYRRLRGSPPPRGGYVTFVTYPDFKRDGLDAYLLFGKLNSRGNAYVEFYPDEAFTLAAVGDAGDTALTLDLSLVRRKPKGFR